MLTQDLSSKSLIWIKSNSIVSFTLHELNILNYSTFTVVFKLVLYTLLLDKSFPVKFTLTNCINFFTSIVNCLHHMVQILVGNMSHSYSICLFILFIIHLECCICIYFSLDCFQLPCLFIKDILFTRESYTFVRFDWIRVHNQVCKF